MKNYVIYILLVSLIKLSTIFKVQAQFVDTTFSVTTLTNNNYDEVVMKITNGGKGLQAIRIHDAIGKEVMYIDLSSLRNQTTFFVAIDISGLKPGIYFCSIYSDKGLLETRRIYRWGAH